MSTVSAAPVASPWSAEVLTFAIQHKVDAYLDPLLEATRNLFPTARSVQVFLEDDPEIRDERYIVFDLRVPRADVPHFVQAQHAWIDELYRVCPAPLPCVFQFSLLMV